LLAVEALTAGKPSFLEKISEIFLSSSAFLLYKTGPEEFIRPVHRQILFGIAVSALIVPLASADLFPDPGPVLSAAERI
jgi:hypothetical protein